MSNCKMKTIRIKRAYDPASAEDGFRILVDRLWPRGLTKEKAAVDLWLKEIAPSTELRKWFDHDATKWEQFKSKYSKELSENPANLEIIRDHLKKQSITLLYAARDTAHNEAILLQEILNNSIAQ